MGFILIAAGLFCMLGAIMNWDFFINSRKARLFVSIFGRNGARVFYGLLGLAIVVGGVLMVAGVIVPKD